MTPKYGPFPQHSPTENLRIQTRAFSAPPRTDMNHHPSETLAVEYHTQQCTSPMQTTVSNHQHDVETNLYHTYHHTLGIYTESPHAIQSNLIIAFNASLLHSRKPLCYQETPRRTNRTNCGARCRCQASIRSLKPRVGSGSQRRDISVPLVVNLQILTHDRVSETPLATKDGTNHLYKLSQISKQRTSVKVEIIWSLIANNHSSGPRDPSSHAGPLSRASPISNMILCDQQISRPRMALISTSQSNLPQLSSQKNS